jgi:hypothetical protein
MAWDQEGQEQGGSSVMVLVPDDESKLRGRILRDQGYAEKMPAIGSFHIDENDGLVLGTEYGTMSADERFWFASPDMRMRTSAVKWFGGFSTASFCVETRCQTEASNPSASAPAPVVSALGW